MPGLCPNCPAFFFLFLRGNPNRNPQDQGALNCIGLGASYAWLDTQACYSTSPNNIPSCDLTEATCTSLVTLLSINNADKLAQTTQKLLSPIVTEQHNKSMCSCLDQGSSLHRCSRKTTQVCFQLPEINPHDTGLRFDRLGLTNYSLCDLGSNHSFLFFFFFNSNI